MQDIVVQKEVKKAVRLAELSLEDKQKLVDVFAWLIKEDKKQNPALYQGKNREYDRHSMLADTQGETDNP